MKIQSPPQVPTDRHLPMHELTARRNRRRLLRPLPPSLKRAQGPTPPPPPPVDSAHFHWAWASMYA